MTKSSNFYRRDAAAALEGMSLMSLEQRGVYNTVIDLLYLTWRPLEDNPKYIAGHCGCAVQKLNPILRQLVEMGKLVRFTEGGRGYLSNGKFDEERLAVKGPTKTRSGRGEVGEKSEEVAENPPTGNENVEENSCVIPLDRVDKTRDYTDSARAIDKPFLDGLERELRAAAGVALNATSPSLLVLTPVLALLRPGQGPPCDTEADVLPTVRALAAKVKPGSVQTWGYFAGAIVEARDRRLSGAGASTVTPKTRPQDWSAERWRVAVTIFAESGRWSEACGPKPGEHACWAPIPILAELGYAPRAVGEIIPFDRSAA